MIDLKGYQKKHLRSIAHSLKPSILVGQKGITPALMKEIENEFERHELIKIKFIEIKDKIRKRELSALIGDTSKSCLVGSVGHTAIFYKQNPKPEKRTIIIPTRSSENNAHLPSLS